MIRPLLVALIVSLSSVALAQRPEEFSFINPTNEVSAELTQERSMVVIATKDKSPEWKEHAEYVHKSFRIMGIDAVYYMHYLDFSSNESIKEQFLTFAERRKVSFMILVYQGEKEFEFAVMDLRKPLVEQSAWFTKKPRLSETIVDLAITLKRTDHVNQNFLISQDPEYISYLPLYEGVRRPNYPDRLKRLRLAVRLIPEVEIPDSLSSLDTSKKLEALNQEIERKNQLIRSSFDGYPYKVEFVFELDDDAVYRQGFQYVMSYLHNSGETIREIMRYDPSDEKEFLSQLISKESQRILTTYAKDAAVYKWYIKQVVVSDLHVGRYWDADADFQKSLESFTTYFRQSLDN